MARFSHSLFASQFVTGVLRYEDYYPNEESEARIVLPISVAGFINAHAIVDTGAPWCVLDPAIVRLVVPASEFRYPATHHLLIRGIWYWGLLFRIGLTLNAEEGENFQVDATIFVPSLRPNELWPHPNFIGLDGFLNRIRYAIDPAENAFYFGFA
jgi:hypothetical protein